MNENGNLNVDELYAPPNSGMSNEESDVPPSQTQPQRETKIPYGVGLTLIICASLSTTFGIPQMLMTVFGVSLMDVLSLPSAAGNNGISAAKALQEETRTLTLITGLINLALSVYAIFIGVRLKNYRRQGLRHSLIWAKAAIAYLAIGQILFFTVTLPISKRVYALMQIPYTTGLMIAVDIIGAVFAAALPVIVLILLSKKSVEQACVEP